MATVCHPASGQVTASFAAVAKHYGVSVAVCPPRRGNRKGVVEKANHTAAQRWWRTLADDVHARAGPGVAGPLVRAARRHPAAPPPATARPPWPPSPRASRSQRCRRRSRPSWPCSGSPRAQALVAFRGNHYSVPPELARAPVTVTHRLGAPSIELATSGGIVIARHQLAPRRGRRHRPRHRTRPGPRTRRDGRVHRPAAPHRRKQRIPPGPAARAAAAALRAEPTRTHHHLPTRHADFAASPGRGAPGVEVMVDLARYAAAAQGRNTLR